MDSTLSEAIEQSTAQDNDDSIIQSTSSGATVETVIKKKKGFTLELPVLLLFFSWNLSGTVFQNQILFQTCTSFFSYNESVCNDLTNSLADDDLQVNFLILTSHQQASLTKTYHLFAFNFISDHRRASRRICRKDIHVKGYT